jgi:hypothetical protein
MAFSKIEDVFGNPIEKAPIDVGRQDSALVERVGAHLLVVETWPGRVRSRHRRQQRQAMQLDLPLEAAARAQDESHARTCQHVPAPVRHRAKHAAKRRTECRDATSMVLGRG